MQLGLEAHDATGVRFRIRVVRVKARVRVASYRPMKPIATLKRRRRPNMGNESVRRPNRGI